MKELGRGNAYVHALEIFANLCETFAHFGAPRGVRFFF
jgi:hypothetical protein